MTPDEYEFDLGLGEVTSDGVKNNNFAMLPMSVPQCCSSDEKQSMHFWLNCGLVWYYAFNHEVSAVITSMLFR